MLKKVNGIFLLDKKKRYSLARKSFFILKPAEAKNLGDAGSDFIHTNNFVLVDQKKESEAIMMELQKRRLQN